MSEMEQQRKLQQQVMQQVQQQQMQQNVNLQQNSQAYATQETMDQAAIQQNISANKYLQNQKDADAAAPDENREELLSQQMTIGHGKAEGIKQAIEKASAGNA